MELTQIQAVIFDMDGVLLDSETISWKTWEIAAQERNLPDIGTVNALCMGANRADTVNILKEHYGKDFDGYEFLDYCCTLFEKIEFSEGIPLMPYVKETLEYLKPKYKIALASSTREFKVRRQLKAAGIIDYFETITTGDMVEHSKPSPDIYLKAAASIGVPAQNCIAVEDSPNGVKSASSANIRTIMIPDKIQPDEKIKALCWKVTESLKNLKEFL
ncbi:MAG: HAD family phosphatase [Treponema sp.]|nr:HAD family phosphatase [Treponema sp.]